MQEDKTAEMFKYCLFYDNHTLPSCPDVGANFDADKFTDRIKDCGITYLTFHARCNMGMAYYDTKIGIKHPSLKKDMFGELAEACQLKGIALCAYFNGGLSHEEGYRHREWTTVTPAGRAYGENFESPFVRLMCYNSGYADHLIAMIEEVLNTYPVAGVFVDCMKGHPCIGQECLEKMKQQGVNWQNQEEMNNFADQSAFELAGNISAAAKKIKPDIMLYFNGMPSAQQAEVGTYLECECLPTGSWGYEYLPILSRYLRTLGLPTINMTGRFHRSWGDFGGIRSEASLKYDCLYGLANGMRPNVGSHFHPRGDINQAEFKLINNVYHDIQRYDSWFSGAIPKVEAAVVSPVPNKAVRIDRANYGAARLLTELKLQFDIVCDLSSWDKYDLLVLADNVILNDDTTERIKKHIAAGKPILATGNSGLNQNKENFVFADEWGIKYKGESECDPAYISCCGKLGKEMPDMPLATYEECIELESTGAEVLAKLTKPYYNHHWDGAHTFYYAPPDKVTDSAAITVNGNIGHIAFPIFKAYYHSGYPVLKKIIGQLLQKIYPKPLVRAENSPSFTRITVTAQPNRRLVHLLSYIPERRGSTVDIIEEPIVLRNLKLSLRLDNHKLKKVYLAPEKKDLDFQITGDYVETVIPEVNGYAMIIFEDI